MNEQIPSASGLHSGTGSAVPLFFCALFAVGFHAWIFYAWKYQPDEVGLIQVLGNSVEVALVESSSPLSEAAPQEASVSPTPVPENPQPPPTTATPKPAPAPEVPAPNPSPESLPLPEEDISQPLPKEVPPPVPRPKPPTAVTKPALSSKPTEPASLKGVTPGAAGDASGKVLGKPLYLVRPLVNYPAESRSAGEQGVVLLRITVNRSGRPTAVSVASSSGFSRLDRAAVEGGWRCRVSNAFDGAQFEAPLRFSLQER